MASDQARALLCRRFTSTTETAIAQHYQVIHSADDGILTPEEIVHKGAGCEVLFVTATERVNADVINALQPSLKAIATLSVGYDHIDLDAARAHGVHVLYTPDVLSDACAEIAMMLLLNACRRGYEADRMVRSGEWPGWAPTQLLGKGLVGQRVGIFGMGRIGRAIAQRLSGFGVSLHYHNRSRLDAALEQGATYHAELDDLLQHSDILVIAAPGTPELKGVINRTRLQRLPAGAVVVNISRGDLIVDDDLMDAVDSGHVFAAGLDVFANEPNIHPRYRRMERIFLSPHIGSATEDTRNAMGALLVDGLLALKRGESPSNLLS